MGMARILRVHNARNNLKFTDDACRCARVDLDENN
ncbi:Hypothetical protein BROD_2450 [Brucella sp. NF 2653]|nr:Hypothetical protein BROD_2450 [Brucella sp. NF 2653]